MTLIRVRVVPNAKQTEIAGREGDAWKIRLSAPPVEGRANEALIRFLAENLDVAPSLVRIVRGHSSKVKTVEIPLHPDDIERLLGD